MNRSAVLDIRSSDRNGNLRFIRKDDQVTVQLWLGANFVEFPLDQAQRGGIRAMLAQADLAGYEREDEEREMIDGLNPNR